MAKVSLPLKSWLITGVRQIGLCLHLKTVTEEVSSTKLFKLQDLQFHFLGSDLPGPGTAVSAHRAC